MKLNEYNSTGVLIFILSAIFFTLAVLSPLSYGGADDIVHYRFARYSFQHPELLLDHWAKPFFTMLASPFAQLGYWGVKLFNILTGAFTGFILTRIAGILQIKRTLWTIVLLFFTPVYTSMLMSGMTEILFAAVLTLSAFFYLKKHHVRAAIAISFLPLVRTEGIIIWPVYAIAFLIEKNWKAIPFMLTASAVYSIIGGLYFGDYLWLINHVPYTGTYDIYGHGDLLHFIRSNKLVFGIPVTLLFVAGVSLRFFQLLLKKNSVTGKDLLYAEFLVILAPLLLYYGAHSYVWWKGINSMGLIRVMAGVAPLFVLYAMHGLNLVIDKIKISWQKSTALAIILFIVIITPFQVYEIPMSLTPKDQMVAKAARWFAGSEYNNRKFYVWESYFYFQLGTDPYNPAKMADGIPDRNHPENAVKPGEIVIWDAHFSAVDGRFPLSAIIENPYYKLIKVFRPAVPFQAGGGTYQICFFERLDSAMHFNNHTILDSLVSIKPNHTEIKLFKLDTGKHKIGEYYMLRELKAGAIDWKEGDELNTKIKVGLNPVTLAVSIGTERKAWFYKTIELAPDTLLELKISLPAPKKNNHAFKIYLWNKDNLNATLDFAEISLLQLCAD